jgi:hypothetical protein
MSRGARAECWFWLRLTTLACGCALQVPVHRMVLLCASRGVAASFVAELLGAGLRSDKPLASASLYSAWVTTPPQEQRLPYRLRSAIWDLEGPAAGATQAPAPAPGTGRANALVLRACDAVQAYLALFLPSASRAMVERELLAQLQSEQLHFNVARLLAVVSDALSRALAQPGPCASLRFIALRLVEAADVSVVGAHALPVVEHLLVVQGLLGSLELLLRSAAALMGPSIPAGRVQMLWVSLLSFLKAPGARLGARAAVQDDPGNPGTRLAGPSLAWFEHNHVALRPGWAALRCRLLEDMRSWTLDVFEELELDAPETNMRVDATEVFQHTLCDRLCVVLEALTGSGPASVLSSPGASGASSPPRGRAR